MQVPGGGESGSLRLLSDQLADKMGSDASQMLCLHTDYA